MLEEVLRAIKDYFIREVRTGTFSIVDGSLDADFLVSGQYFKINGSLLNDGVYQWPTDKLTDETFAGEVWAMAVPKAVIALAEDVEAWQQKYGTADSAAMSPYNSESFGGYSYSKSAASGGSGGAGGVSWQSVFASRLNQWRKIRYEPFDRGNDGLRHPQ